MPSLRYLNSVLTIIAVLLTLNIYALWTASPAGSVLDAVVPVQAAEAAGLPNAGQQRKDMLDELKKVNSELGKLSQTLTSGQVRVRLENPPRE